MTTRDSIWKRLRDLLVEVGELDPSLVTEEASLNGELSIESVAFVEIVVAIEEEFEVEIDPLEVLDQTNLGAIVDYVFAMATNLSGEGFGLGR